MTDQHAPRAVSSRPCPTGEVAYRDEWVGYVHWKGDRRPFLLCPDCLNWHDPQGLDRSAIPAPTDQETPAP